MTSVTVEGIVSPSPNRPASTPSWKKAAGNTTDALVFDKVIGPSAWGCGDASDATAIGAWKTEGGESAGTSVALHLFTFVAEP